MPISVDRAVQNFPPSAGKDHFLYNNLYNRDVEYMKNLIRTSASDVERNPNALMHCSDFNLRQVHDHQHGHSPQPSCFVPKSEHPSILDHQQRLFPCGEGPHMLPMAARSYSCSQLGSLVDYSSETIKQQQHQHHCKSEKHDEVSTHLSSSSKCQILSDSRPNDSPGILVKSEFNEMQQSKSSPVHEVFEMTSSNFPSTVTGTVGENATGNGNGNGSVSGSSSGNGSSQFHYDSGSPPLSLMETANSTSTIVTSVTHQLQHHHHHHPHHNHPHHHQLQHQCSAHSYDSYVYASGSAGRVGMSSRQQPGTMNTTSTGSEISGGLYRCKSFFSDSTTGNGSPGIGAFYPNTTQQHQLNGEPCRDDTGGFPNRDSLDTHQEKLAIAIKARKIPD